LLFSIRFVGEIAGAGRFAADAKPARAAGVATAPVSPGNTNRHRPDRGGKRQNQRGRLQQPPAPIPEQTLTPSTSGRRSSESEPWTDRLTGVLCYQLHMTRHTFAPGEHLAAGVVVAAGQASQ
jgi:hypothetical protein